ncbi:glycosyltransferase family 9 protein [Candidatus Pelagibacter sp. Uisw_127]|uniref:glycosyltransferase family 9 protein n=1 Tax=Candidatus Pelagibacter sp. Uisw_127 TaxID=3230988 RepID=UPI0039E7D807
MNNYLIFRTDRIGDFLLTAILINSIKRNDPNSHINLVSSTKNYHFIKSFKNVDEVIILKNNLLDKIKLIHKLRSVYYDKIIVHDAKNRSSIISFFLKYGLKIKPDNYLDISYIDSIKEIISKLNFDFIELDLNTLNNRGHNFFKDLNENFILLHLDEKWIYNNYISEYTNIEPLKDELISFINLLLTKTKKKLVITTGIRSPSIINDIISIGLSSRVKVYKKLDFLYLENLISKCKLLISCHGAVSHVAAAHQIKQIDIIEKTKLNFYSKWTHHFRNYHSIHRKPFDKLSTDIIKLL